MSRNWTFLNLLLLPLITHQSFAQTSVQTEVYHKYQESTNPSLYRNTAYPIYLPKGIYDGQHPCFVSPRCKPGTMLYNGRAYQKVALKYDIIIDEVFILWQDSLSEVGLDKSKLAEFSIGNSDFINIPEGKNIKPGYYEVLQKRNTKVIRKLKKTYKPTVMNGNAAYNMIEEDTPKYYMEKDQAFYLIKNEKSLYKLFPEKKKELKHFISNNQLQVKEAPDLALPIIAEFIDQ